MSWIKKHKILVALIVLIVIVGGFLRLYHVGGWMHFGQDEGRDAFVVAGIASGNIPALGPAAPNNSPDFHLGPFFYYLLFPFYFITGLSPAGGALTVALLSVASIVLVYIIGRKLFSQVAGIVAASLYSVSFLMVYYGRWAWNPNVVPFFMLLIVLSLFQLTTIQHDKKKERYIYLLAASFGIIIQLHGTALIAVPALLALFFILYRPKISWKKYALAFIIILFVNAPQIVYDITHGFGNSRGFVRILFQSESGASLGFFERIRRIAELTHNFFQEALFRSDVPMAFGLLFGALVIFVGIQLYRIIKQRGRDARIVIPVMWLFIPLLVFIFYKEAIPIHYFCMIFPVPFILFGWFFHYIWEVKKIRMYGLMIFASILGLQLISSANLLYDLSPEGSRESSYPVTLDEMQSVVEYIETNASGESFNFYSLPAGSYNRSYQYLFEKQDIPVSVVPAENAYIAITGNEAAIPDTLSIESITDMRVFGNVTIFSYTNTLDY